MGTKQERQEEDVTEGANLGAGRSAEDPEDILQENHDTNR